MFTSTATPLSERVEYLSDAWFDAASTWAAGAGGTWPAFSRSVRCGNPPAHLAGQALGYTVTLGTEGISVTRGWDASADLFEDLDYNAAQWLDGIVTEDNAESAARRRSEYLRLFNVTDRAGLVPEGVRPTLDGLRDHLARRTVVNPDVAHRIASFGLADNTAGFDDTGYTVFENAFSDDFAGALRGEAAVNHAGRDQGASFRATMLIQRGSLWEEAALHPWILTAADYLVGRGCLMYQSDTIVKETGQETHPGLHSDYAASRITEPFPEFCVLTVAVWAIDDFQAEHGPTVILPGSYRKRSQVPPGTTQEGAVKIEMKQGSIAMWNGATWHGSTPRTAPGKRTSLHNTYCRNYLRPLESYLSIDPAIVRRNPPAFSSLCGLDDAFGKSGEEGADFERLTYAARAGFAGSGALATWKT